LNLLERIPVPRPGKLWHIIDADRRNPMDQAEQTPMKQSVVQVWRTYTHAYAKPWLRWAWMICCLLVTVDIFMNDAFMHQYRWLRLFVYLVAIVLTGMLLRNRQKREDRPETS
jgi:hypothetical protein